MSMFKDYHLCTFPPYAKLFVGIFTTLMLLVCGWAVTILYVEKGVVDENERLADWGVDVEQQQDAGLYAGDSEAVLAPVWDSDLAGQEVQVDSTSELEHFRRHDEQAAGEVSDENEEEHDLRENIGLAHTHINGQTLLFFAMGLVFLFTSVTPFKKKVTLWLFGGAVVLHAIGLSGEGYHWFFDDILAVSGVAILGVIVYMALRIYVDLAKRPRREGG